MLKFVSSRMLSFTCLTVYHIRDKNWCLYDINCLHHVTGHCLRVKEYFCVFIFFLEIGARLGHLGSIWIFLSRCAIKLFRKLIHLVLFVWPLRIECLLLIRLVCGVIFYLVVCSHLFSMLGSKYQGKIALNMSVLFDRFIFSIGI